MQNPATSNRYSVSRRTALLTAAVFASALAYGQQSEPTAPDAAEPEKEKVVTLETFTVRAGFAGSLAAAADMKQKQELISEVIHAEDLGKLPDISIADSITRLPGITTQRTNGRAQGIVIRGMNGDYSTGLLNGRQQVSTAASRAMEFDQYPAELLNSVVVYKTTQPGLIGQGLAGTVDLQTIRPLSRSNREITVNAFYEWTGMEADNAGAETGGLRETIAYIDQFADGKVGLAIGVSLSSRPGQGQQFNAWGYDSSYPGGTSLLGGAKPFVRTSTVDRDGYMAVLEFKPNNRIHSVVDFFYSKFSEDQLLRGIEMPINPNWGTGTMLQPGYTVKDGLITDATVTNFFGVVRNDFVQRKDDVFAAGWNLVFDNEKGWRTTFDASVSTVKRTDFVLETYSGFGVNGVGLPDTITYHLSPDGSAGARFDHVRDYSTGLRLGMPQGWGTDPAKGRPFGQHGFAKGPIAQDTILQYSLKTEKEFDGFLKKIEGGVTYNNRDKGETESGPGGMEGFFLQLKNGAASAPLPPSVGLTDLGFIGMGKMYSYDPLALYNSGFYDKIPNDDPNTRSNNFDVIENIWTGYVKSDFDFKIGGTPATATVGTQVVHTEQNSRGLAISGVTVTPVTGEHTFTDWVPSASVTIKFTPQTLLRFAAARQTARQPMVDMRAGSTYSFTPALAGSTDVENSPWAGSGGNPKLEPWRSNSFDVSLDHYFKDRMGYWSVALFHKKLVSYTYVQRTLADFTGFPTGSIIVPAINQGYSLVPVNGQGGVIKGAEFTLSLPGEKFTSMLKGWGVIGSASFFRSSIQPDLSSPATPLPGLSERVMNGTIYYESHGFSARVSARYRSNYRGDIATFGFRGAIFRNLQPETVVDAQVSYTFPKKTMLKGLTVIAQAYNLNDEPLVATSGEDVRFIQDYQRYGPSYSVGASYKF